MKYLSYAGLRSGGSKAIAVSFALMLLLFVFWLVPVVITAQVAARRSHSK